MNLTCYWKVPFLKFVLEVSELKILEYLKQWNILHHFRFIDYRNHFYSKES